MADKPFVINDRRKFTAEGDIRPDVERSPAEPTPEPSAPVAAEAEASRGPQLVTEATAPEETVAAEAPAAASEEAEQQAYPEIPAEQFEQVTRAYNATLDRLDTAVRAMDPGGQHMPAMNFERFIQSLYMQALMQLGGIQDPSGQPPRVDLMGARSTIDMLGLISEKADGNLNESETKLLTSALFELRMAFLEVTQALSQQAAQRGPGGAPGSMPPPPGGPTLIR
ncbi:MAG: DUF1844 domain-containing protein [Acidobacteriaceae bacterium]|nr:DUF1844 domain-containing protein [Acidobacteriaceae bacterium]